MGSMDTSKNKSSNNPAGLNKRGEALDKRSNRLGLSHIKAWRRCIELDQDVLVAEDDAILANDLKHKLEELNIIGRTPQNRPD